MGADFVECQIHFGLDTCTWLTMPSHVVPLNSSHVRSIFGSFKHGKSSVIFYGDGGRLPCLNTSTKYRDIYLGCWNMRQWSIAMQHGLECLLQTGALYHREYIEKINAQLHNSECSTGKNLVGVDWLNFSSHPIIINELAWKGQSHHSSNQTLCQITNLGSRLYTGLMNTHWFTVQSFKNSNIYG